jgi:hypothetical protein
MQAFEIDSGFIEFRLDCQSALDNMAAAKKGQAVGAPTQIYCQQRLFGLPG